MDEFDDIRSFLASRAFVPTLDEIRRSGASGYLTLSAGAESTTFQISDGCVQRLADEGSRALEEALAEAGVPDRKVQRARKRSRKENLRFSRIVEEDIHLDRDIQGELLGRRLTDLFLEFATADDLAPEWTEGALDPARHDEAGDDPPAGVPLADVIVLIPEDWNDAEILRSIHPAETEVFQAVAEIEPRDLDDVSSEVVALADGEKDVAEIIEASRFSRHEVLGALHLLAGQRLVCALDADALMALATDFRRMGRLDKCLRLNLRAEQVGEPTFALAETIGGIYEMMGEGEKAVNVFAACARRALENERADEATRAYEKVLGLFPHHGEALLELHKIYRAADNVPRAVELLRRLAGFRASRADAPGQTHALLSIVELGHADAGVLDDLAPLLIEQKGEEDTLRFLGETARSCARAGQRDVALAALTHAARLAPRSAEVALDRGHLLREAGDDDRALTELLRAVRLIESGEDESVSEKRHVDGCEAILALDASQVETRMRLASLYRESGRENRALEHMRALADGGSDPSVLEQIARLDPRDLDVKKRLAESYAAADRLAEASATYLALARELMKARNLEGARASVEEILKLDPVNVEARLSQATILDELGLEDEARVARTRLFHIVRWAGLVEEALDIGRDLTEEGGADVELVRSYASLLVNAEPSSSGSRLVSLARRAIREKRPGLALELTEQALSRSPRSSTARKLRDELSETDDLSTASGLERIYEMRSEKRIRIRTEEIEARGKEEIRRQKARLREDSENALDAEKQHLEEELDRRTDEAHEKARAEADALVEERTSHIDQRVADLAAEQAEDLRREMEEALADARESLAEESKAIRKTQRADLVAECEAELEKRDLERERRAEEALERRIEEHREENELRIQARARAAEEEVLATLDKRRQELESEMEMTLAERLRELGEAADKELEERQARLAAELHEKAERESAEAAKRVERELEERRAALETESEKRYSEREDALREEVARELAADKERLEAETSKTIESKTAELENESKARLDESLEAMRRESAGSLAEAKAKLEGELEAAHDERLEALETELAEKEEALRKSLEEKTTAELEQRRTELETEFEERVDEKETAARERFEAKLEEETARLEQETAAELETRKAALEADAEKDLARKQGELGQQFQDALSEAKRDLALALEERAKRHEEQWRDSADADLAQRKQALEDAAKTASDEAVTRLENEAEAALTEKRHQIERDSEETVAREKSRLEEEIGKEAAIRLEESGREMEKEHERRLASVEADVRRRVSRETDQAKARLREEAQREEARLQAFYSIRHAGQPDEVKAAVEAGVQKLLVRREDEIREKVEAELEKRYEDELAEARQVMVRRDEKAKKSPEAIRAPAAPAPVAAPAPSAPPAAPRFGILNKPAPQLVPASAPRGAGASAGNPAAAAAGTPSGAKRDHFISNDLIANAAAAARQIRMGGMGGGAPAGGAGAAQAGPPQISPPTPPRDLPSDALSGIVGKLKAMKGQGLGVAPTPANAGTTDSEPAAAPQASDPAPEAMPPEPAPVDEKPAVETAVPAKAGPIDFKTLAKQSVSDIVSGLESGGGNG